MTRTTNARVAGAAFLLYIAIGITILMLSNRASGAPGIAAKLAGIAEHATLVRVNVVLSMLTGLAAVLLGVTLHGLTRDEDPDLAMLALTCRAGEGLFGAVPVVSLGLLWLGTTRGAADAPDPAAAAAIAAFLLKLGGWTSTVAATLFAVGSTIFSWLMLRGRMIPVPLARLGVVSSVVLVAAMPLRLAGFVPGSIVQYLWLPMAVFEIWLAARLILKGAALPARRLAT